MLILNQCIFFYLFIYFILLALTKKTLVVDSDDTVVRFKCRFFLVMYSFLTALTVHSWTVLLLLSPHNAANLQQLFLELW